MLKHVGANAGLGFGVGGGFGIETDGFRGAAVIHGSGQDQVSKGDFLIGDGSVTVFLGIGRLVPWSAGVWNGLVCCSFGDFETGIG